MMQNLLRPIPTEDPELFLILGDHVYADTDDLAMAPYLSTPLNWLLYFRRASRHSTITSNESPNR